MHRFLFYSLLIFIGCQNDQATPVTKLPMGFMAFYDHFHRDSLYQLNHIQFPLEGIPTNALEMGMADTVFTWNRDSWIMHRPFTDEDSMFNKVMYALDTHIVIEKIRLKTNEFGMERRFLKRDGSWELIYYAGMNRLKVNESADVSKDVIESVEAVE